MDVVCDRVRVTGAGGGARGTTLPPGAALRTGPPAGVSATRSMRGGS